MDSFTYLKNKINHHYSTHNLHRPFIVAVDGLGGAGKTTLVQQLKQDLEGIVTIHIDDHIVERNKRYDTGHEEWFEYYQLQWDVEFLKTNFFEKLHRNDSEFILSFYYKNEDRYEDKEIFIPAESIVIVEGVFLLREEWKSYFDLIIFLDCPKEVRYERVIQRDAYIGSMEERLKKYENRYWPAEDYYFKKQKPLEVAHIVYRVNVRHI